jgi:toxin CcdB
MAQFWIYKNINRAYLLDIQSSLLDDLQATVVIPLHRKASIGNAAITRLCPEVEIEGEKVIALTPQLAGVDRKILGQKICDLSVYRSDIIAAVDLIISGI